MPCSSRASRRGVGLALALVLWVVAMVLINALVQSQATSSSFVAMVRMTHARTATFAARSALEEAAFVLRHAPNGISKIVDGFESGRASGAAHEPNETRSLYQPLEGQPEGALAIEPVNYEFVGGLPDRKAERFLLDLTVRVRFANAPGNLAGLTRLMRRRYPGRVARIVETMGPKKDQVVYVILTLDPDPILEVLEP